MALLNKSVNQAVSQLLEILLNKIFLNFHINLVEGLMVNVKTFLSLAMANQYCLNVTK